MSNTNYTLFKLDPKKVVQKLSDYKLIRMSNGKYGIKIDPVVYSIPFRDEYNVIQTEDWLIKDPRFTGDMGWNGQVSYIKYLGDTIIQAPGDLGYILVHEDWYSLDEPCVEFTVQLEYQTVEQREFLDSMRLKSVFELVGQ